MKNTPLSCLSVAIMCSGIFGMSIFSVPPSPPPNSDSTEVPFINGDDYTITQSQSQSQSQSQLSKNKPTNYTTLFGWRCTRFTAGIIAAVFNGCWGGSIMVPFKYVPKGTTGMQYLVSFAVGAAIVTSSLWIILFFYNCSITSSLQSAWNELPCLHFAIMWKPGITSGILWR